eukprot:234286_1
MAATLSAQLSCAFGATHCEPARLMWPWRSPMGRNWQDRMLDPWAERADTELVLNVRVFSDISMDSLKSLEEDGNNVVYAYKKSDQLFWIIEVAIECGLHIVLLTVFLVYLTHLKCREVKTVSEQKWVILLLLAALLFQLGMLLLQLPLQIPGISLEVSREVLQATGNLFQTISTSLIAFFFLLIADTIHRASIDTQPADLVTVWKVSLAVANICASIVWIFISTWSHTSLFESSFDNSLQTTMLTMLYVTSIVVWGVTAVIWLVWILHLSCSAYQELRFWNFQTTRFRQLSFRFFVNQSWQVIVYFLIIWTVWFTTDFGIYGTESSPVAGLGTFLVITVYSLLSAYGHFPVKGGSADRGADEDDSRGFSLNVARWMCDLSWQAYGVDPIADVSPTHKVFPINVEKYGLQLVEVGGCDESDIQWFVAVNGDTIVLSFRGSRSMKNLVRDCRVSQTYVNDNFWYTGDPSFVNPTTNKYAGTTRVHSGFFDAYLRIRQDVLRCITNIMYQGSPKASSAREFDEIEGFGESPLAAHTSPHGFKRLTKTPRRLLDKILQMGKGDYKRVRTSPYTVYVTGHSLGGALATYCCLEIRSLLNLTTRLYTFGSPAVGCPNFSRLFSTIVPGDCSFRVVFEQDVITTFPPLPAKYKHVEAEVYIDRAGNLIFSPSFVERSILPGRTRFDHHLLSGYLSAIEAACLQHGIAHRPCDDDFSVGDLFYSDGI